jgi:hypothetical protein
MIGFDLEETPKICAINPCCQIKEPALVGSQENSRRRNGESPD